MKVVHIGIVGLLTIILSLNSLIVFGEEEKAADGDSAVHVLTNSNFDEFLKENSVVLVEFYAPWCGHCKRLEPEYEKAAKALKEKGSDVKLAKVDATAETDVANKQDVKGYPTIKLFRKGEPEEYTGGRTADTIIEWLEKMTGPSYTVADTMEAALEMIKGHSVGYVGAFKKDSKGIKHFEAVADKNRVLGKYVAVIHADGTEEVHVHRKDEDRVSHSVKDEDALHAFVKDEFFPLFGPISGENFAQYSARDQELVWYCGTEKNMEQVSSIMRDVAKKFRKELSLVWLDTDKYAGHAENALGISEYPGLVLQSKKGRFVFPSSEVKDAAEIIKFFEDVLAGKIEKNLKSEPVPEKNDDPVKVVVAKTFENMVLDKEKDVMLEVYAPWCGHCKKLEPIYNEFAESMAHNKHLVVAKMDGTANESPVESFEWSGFPTIFFVKAGQKEPMRFEGARTVEGLTEFVKKHSTQEVKTKDEL